MLIGRQARWSVLNRWGISRPTLWETLKDFDGMANDLPADLANNLDHYVHGHARP
jgi:hypothetical protein